MKVLVLTCDSNISSKRMHEEIKRMSYEASNYGIMNLPKGINAKVIEFDAMEEDTNYDKPREAAEDQRV